MPEHKEHDRSSGGMCLAGMVGDRADKTNLNQVALNSAGKICSRPSLTASHAAFAIPWQSTYLQCHMHGVRAVIQQGLDWSCLDLS